MSANAFAASSANLFVSGNTDRLHAIVYSAVFINKTHSVSSHQRTLLVINKTEDHFSYINE